MVGPDLPLFLITGTPGAGKSVTAAALMRRFPFGLHIPVDELREWVVSGISQPVPEFTEETARQFRLARSAAAQVAALYTDAGFAVAIDDVIHEPDVLSVSDGRAGAARSPQDPPATIPGSRAGA